MEFTSITVDKLIQTHIMGWSEYNPLFSPTTNILDAYRVEEKLYEMGYQVLVRRCTGDRCGLISGGYAKEGDFFCNVSDDERNVFYKTVASTPQKAISYSAIKTMGFTI